jgi:hypothetical protein
MDQIAEINDGLREREQPIPASLLGMQGMQPSSGSDSDDNGLPGDAPLIKLTFDGPPDYPYIHGHFGTDPSGPGSSTVELHTDALRKLSRTLRLQHVWG